MAAYGGDEVNAIVLDMGTYSTRIGYAGEDLPKVNMPATYGSVVDQDNGSFKHYVGDEGVNVYRPKMRLSNPMREGMIYEWNAVEDVLNYAFNTRLRCDTSDHPILFTEPPWNNKHNRERMAEILFEKYEVPATFVVNNAVCAAFAAGKGTALVIDVGQDISSVTPVVDGYALTKHIQRQPIGMSLLTNTAYMTLTTPTPERPEAIELHSHQLIANKKPMGYNAKPVYTLRQDRLANADQSWRNQMARRVVEDWLEVCGGALETTFTVEEADKKGTKFYEFPTGYQAIFKGSERLQPAEIFFNASALNRIRAYGPPPVAENYPSQGRMIPLQEAVPLQHLVAHALEVQDIDIRAGLMQNMVLTGGGSLLPGFQERLLFELSNLTRNKNYKFHIPQTNYERRFGSWVGGSILASLGTFHQLWVSREEWSEFGPDILAQRCK